MENKFLQEFLDTGLFDIGDNDERLQWLQNSIEDLRKKFEQDFSLLPKFTLVALDPNISDIEPIMIETQSIITVHWKTLRSKYREMPRNIIRGVILNALNNVGIVDPIAARIICLTGLSFYPYAKLNTEKNLIFAMLNTLGEIAEKNATDEWSIAEEAPQLKLGTLKIANLKYETVRLDEDKLKEKWKPAFGSTATGIGPQNGLHHPDYQAHFLSESTNAIASSFNSALEKLNKSLPTTDIESSINKFFIEFKKALDANLKPLFQVWLRLNEEANYFGGKKLCIHHRKKEVIVS